MFTRALKQCSNEKRRFFGENQFIFVYGLPIDFFSISQIFDGRFLVK